VLDYFGYSFESSPIITTNYKVTQKEAFKNEVQCEKAKNIEQQRGNVGVGCKEFS
jgi:hypothetical protein